MLETIRFLGDIVEKTKIFSEILKTTSLFYSPVCEEFSKIENLVLHSTASEIWDGVKIRFDFFRQPTNYIKIDTTIKCFFRNFHHLNRITSGVKMIMSPIDSTTDSKNV